MKRLKTSSFLSLIAVFAAFSIVCDASPGPPLPYSGVWSSWTFIAEPISGIVLGPCAGFFSSFVGVMVGHSINFRDSSEFLFTLGAPLGAMISGLLFRKKWKIALVYYLALLGAYFVTPVSWQLPFWGMWDVYLAFGCLLSSIVAMNRMEDFWDTKSTRVRLLYVIGMSTFIGLEADVLFRIFVLVPCRCWTFFGWDVSTLQSIWVVAAVETSIKAALSILVNIVVMPPILKAVRKMYPSLLEKLD